EGSFLDFLLLEMEKVHAKVRRYTSPDEYPFNHPLPDPILPCLNYPQTLKPNDINVNKQIMDMYVTQIVPEICKQGDDSNHGSSATKDVECLQALSKRIHYGKFIAEAKFQQDTEKYTKLIKANDRQGILELLTNRAVEEKLLKRLKRKAMIYGQDIDSEDNVVVANGHSNGKIDLDAVVKLYELFVIPLTKEVEVEYLMKRLG
ncbi:chorismate mutase, partial [Paraphysoderma sedebokerense]